MSAFGRLPEHEKELAELRCYHRKGHLNKRLSVGKRARHLRWARWYRYRIRRQMRRLQKAARKKGNGGWKRDGRGWRYQLLAKAYKGKICTAVSEGAPLKALRVAGTFVGKHEAGYNDASWLRQMERELVAAGYPLGWMIPGQPYCGFGVLYCYFKAGVKLPAGMVYTPNIPSYAGKNFNGYKLVRVSPSRAKPGAIVVFNWGSGEPKHVAKARGPARGGQIPTREFNTSPSNAGSQSNGGGVYDRSRSTALLHSVYNVVKA